MKKIEFFLEKEDFVQFNLYNIKKQFDKKIIKYIYNFIYYLLILYLILSFFIEKLSNFSIKYFDLITLVITITILTFKEYFFEKLIWYNLDKQKILWKTEIYFKKDFLKVQKNWNESKIPFTNLNIEENWNYLYLYTTSISALIIPLKKIWNIISKNDIINTIK